MYSIKTKIKYTLKIKVKTAFINGSKPWSLSNSPRPKVPQIRKWSYLNRYKIA